MRLPSLRKESIMRIWSSLMDQLHPTTLLNNLYHHVRSTLQSQMLVPLQCTVRLVLVEQELSLVFMPWSTIKSMQRHSLAGSESLDQVLSLDHNNSICHKWSTSILDSALLKRQPCAEQIHNKCLQRTKERPNMERQPKEIIWLQLRSAIQRQNKRDQLDFEET